MPEGQHGDSLSLIPDEPQTFKRQQGKPPLKKTILIIDDSRFQRKANEGTFGRAGYCVLSAVDGEEGLRIARDKIPDVVLLDMMLPKLDGPALLHALKNDRRTAGIPVIVLSSLPQINAAKLKSDGAAAYFEKSKLATENGSSELISTVEGVVSSSRINR